MQGLGWYKLKIYIALLAMGFSVVILLTTFSSPLRYPFLNDSTGYIQEADNLLAGNGLVRTPPLSQTETDLAPSRLFPPGYSILIAAGSSLGIPTSDTAVWAARASWALLPAALFFALAPLLRTAAAVWCSILVLLSPSAYQYGFAALSDVPFLLLTVLMFGSLFRGLAGSSSRHYLMLSGILAGLGYATRNPGIAIFAAVAGAFLIATAARIFPFRDAANKLSIWSASSLVVLAPLYWRNAVEFGKLQPYQGTQSGLELIESSRIFLEGFFLDLSGLPLIANHLAWDFTLLLLIGMPLAVLLLIGLRQKFVKRTSSERFAILALTAYLVTGSVMVIVAQVLHGVEGDLRYAMQYTWVFLALAAIGFSGQRKPIWMTVPLTAALVLLVAGRAIYIQQDLVREREMAFTFHDHKNFVEAAQQLHDKRWITTNQIKYKLAQDAELRRAIKRLPANAFITSNFGSFLQHVARPRIIRTVAMDNLINFEWVGQLSLVGLKVSPKRPLYCIIFPNNLMLKGKLATTWQEVVTEKTAPHFHVTYRANNFIILRYGGTGNHQPNGGDH